MLRARAHSLATLIGLTALIATPVALVPDATAAVQPFTGCGSFKADNPADGTDVVSSSSVEEAEILESYVNTDATGAEFVMKIKNLTGMPPVQSGAIQYRADYTLDGAARFVRAFVDKAGMVAYEYGAIQDVGGQTTVSDIEGATTGELVTGAQGLVRVLIPKEAGGEQGKALKGFTAASIISYTGVVPSGVAAPSRGVGYQHDDVALGSVLVGPCAEPAPEPAEPGATPVAPQPVIAKPAFTAVTKLKPTKAKRKATLTVSSSAPLTKVTAKLRKGKKVHATGKLASLPEKGKLKLSVKKAVKKGTYKLALAGVASDGSKVTGTFTLRVR